MIFRQRHKPAKLSDPCLGIGLSARYRTFDRPYRAFERSASYPTESSVPSQYSPAKKLHYYFYECLQHFKRAGEFVSGDGVLVFLVFAHSP